MWWVVVGGGPSKLGSFVACGVSWMVRLCRELGQCCRSPIVVWAVLVMSSGRAGVKSCFFVVVVIVANWIVRVGVEPLSFAGLVVRGRFLCCCLVVVGGW